MVDRKIKSSLSDIAHVEKQRMGEKLFLLDHSAQVLENYRKIEEIKLYNAIQHEQKEKQAALKITKRKLENLLPDFQTQSQLQTHSGVEFLESTRKQKQLEEKRYDKLNKSEFLLYEDRKKELQNKQIAITLKDRSKNPEVQKFLEERSKASDTSLVSQEEEASLQKMEESAVAQEYAQLVELE